ncbi:MAG: cation-translocating P-type ATPase [Verrucomicrobia bacterium]|nr:cation-translocating P-type ATPase [Verrucomicrobiota bacterium]
MAHLVKEEEPAWVRDLRSFLRDQKEVQAIRVSQDTQTVSVATFGDQSFENIEIPLTELIKTVETGLKASVSDGTHLSEDGLWVRTAKDETVVEKTQCPAVRSLWTWREYKWPSEDVSIEDSDEEWKWMALLAGICGVSLLVAFGLDHFTFTPAWVIKVLYLFALISGGWDAVVDTSRNLKRGQLDIHFLMLAVALGAVAIGSWAEGALLLFLFSLSGALEHFAEHRTHQEIDSLTRSAPKTARVVEENGNVVVRPVESVRPGDVLWVKPDELFPVDGEVLSGQTASDESNLTGEGTPVEKIVGDEVYSGTLNLWGMVTIRVVRLAAESALQKIIRLIQDAQHLRAPSQRFTDKFGTRYTYLILGITVVYFLFSWLVLMLPAFEQSEGSFSAFYRAMTFLVVASPCALVLSIPSAILAAIAWGARKGILFRGGAAIEKLAEVDVVALDKTGTLTQGDLAVTGVESFPEGRANDVLQLAFSLETHSNHPIARAIVNYGKKEGLEPKEVENFQSFSGKGLRGQVEDESIFLGRRELMESGPLAEWIERVEEPPASVTEVWVFQKDLIGRILLEDKIRERSKDTLERLKNMGIKTLMLTGDRRSAAEAVGQTLGIQEVRSGLMPEEKVQIIKELTDAGHKVAMVGDGVNDAPSLAASYVAVAMGARGSDAALEQSEVVLMNDKIEKFLTAFELSRKAKSIIRQNLVISLGTVLLMASAALFGLIPLTLGVFAHEGSTVVVCLNSLRLLMGEE